MPVSDPAAPFGPANHPLRLFRPGYLSRVEGVPLRNLEFVALDFETTGLEPRTDRVVEVAACRFRADGAIVEEYATRIAPGRRRVGDSRLFHGLTDDDLKGAPGFGEVWPELRRLLSGAVVVAHNLRFEDDFLRRELDRIQIDLLEPPPGVCTMVASWTHLRLFNYKQKNIFRTVVGTWPEDAHTALGDVRNLSAILAALYRRMPDLRYVGPPPVEFDGGVARGHMYARPAVEAAIRWNSLPLTSVDHHVSDTAAAALRAGCLKLLDTCRRRDRIALLIELMATVGVGAGQFVRRLGTTLAAVLAEDPASLDHMCLDLLDDLMETLESAEFADILIDAILTGQSCKGMPAPVLYGERWRVPKEHPEREYLDELLTSLGAEVLLTVRPNLDARVVRQTVHRDTVLDLHPYLADLRRRSVEESAAYLRDWAEKRRGRYRTTPDIPLGTSSGDKHWDSVMVFEARDPELAPNWRWAARGFRGNPKSRANLDRKPWYAEDEDSPGTCHEELHSHDGLAEPAVDAGPATTVRTLPVEAGRDEPAERRRLLQRLAVALTAVEQNRIDTPEVDLPGGDGRGDDAERGLLSPTLAAALRALERTRTVEQEASRPDYHGGNDDQAAASLPRAEPRRTEARQADGAEGRGSEDDSRGASPASPSAAAPGFRRFLLSLAVLGITCWGWTSDAGPKWAGVVVAAVLFIWAAAA